ncbi:glycosyltransferase family 39 protein [bacterium]|nr:glycosyltransferase family 39 protein [bacterium]
MNILFLKSQKIVTLVILLFLLISTSLFCFYQLGNSPLASYDEGIYAQVARESRLENHPFDLTWQGYEISRGDNRMLEKSPFYIWIINFFVNLFGENEFALRLSSAVFAFLLIVAVFLWVLETYKSALLGLLASLITLSSFQFLLIARSVSYDMVFSFFVILSLFFLARTEKQKCFYILAWIAIAFGVLAKNVIGLLPLIAFIIYKLIKNDFSWLKKKYFWIGFFVFLGLVLPWHLYAWFKNGQYFWQVYIIWNLFKRYAGSIFTAHQLGPWFYLDKVFYRQFSPWSIIALIALSVSISRFFQNLKKKQNSPSVFFAIFILIYFLLFQFSKDKLATYMMPLFPLLAIIIVDTLHFGFDCLKNKLKLRKILMTATITFFLILSILTARNSYQKVTYFKEHWSPAIISRTLGLALHNLSSNSNVYISQSGGFSLPSIIFYANRKGIFWVNNLEEIQDQNFYFVANEGNLNKGYKIKHSQKVTDNCFILSVEKL